MTDGSSGSRLGHATLQGVRWVAVGRVATETIAFGSGIVLARLVPPAEFGRAAVAMIVVALAAILGPVGLTAVLIQRKSVDRCDLEAASFLSLVSGVVLTAATLAFAHAGAPSVFGGETARLIGLASPAWLISAISAVPQAQIQRDLRFQVVAVIDSVSVLAGAAVALGLAAGGVDAAAVVAGGLATTATGTVIAVLAAPSARPRPNREGLANVGGFAASVSASSLVYSMFRNVDYAILGIRLAPRAVGLYWRAYQLGVDYQSKISQIMLRVAFPVYSRTESMDELRRFRRRIVRTHAVVVVPLMCFFIAIAPELVPRVYGGAWRGAVGPAQIMAVAGMAYSIATGTGPLMVAVGKPRALLVWNLCELVLYAILVALLAPHGLTAVAIGVSCFAAGSLLVIQVFLLRPYAGLPVRGLLDDITPGVVAGGGVLGVLALVRVGLGGDVGGVSLVAVLAVVGAAVYAVVLRALFASEWRDLESIVRRLGSRRAVHEQPLEGPVS